MQYFKKYVLVLILLFSACNPVRGCAESDFDLAPESRLPRWFTLPQGLRRSDVTVVMTYYISLFGDSTANFVLYDDSGRKLAGVEGEVRDPEPLTLTPAPATGPIPYPSYAVVTINGITEVIEHRQRGSVFYIADDTDVKRRLGVLH